MTGIIIIGLIVGWVVMSAVFVLAASMMSARISHREEYRETPPVLEIPPRSTSYKPKPSVHTQPTAGLS